MRRATRIMQKETGDHTWGSKECFHEDDRAIKRPWKLCRGWVLDLSEEQGHMDVWSKAKVQRGREMFPIWMENALHFALLCHRLGMGNSGKTCQNNWADILNSYRSWYIDQENVRWDELIIIYIPINSNILINYIS